MPIFRNTSIIIEPNKTVITTLFNTQTHWLVVIFPNKI
jgi:hypothetical protein